MCHWELPATASLKCSYYNGWKNTAVTDIYLNISTDACIPLTGIFVFFPQCTSFVVSWHKYSALLFLDTNINI